MASAIANGMESELHVFPPWGMAESNGSRMPVGYNHLRLPVASRPELRSENDEGRLGISRAAFTRITMRGVRP
jgi:hypothetical protein